MPGRKQGKTPHRCVKKREQEVSMFIEERHRLILEYLAKNGSITTNDIIEQYNVSYDTAKRDLRILDEKGLLKRTHGGALPLHQVAIGRPPRETIRDVVSIKENYYQIALKAVSMIADNDVVYLSPATVGYFMAKNMPTDRKVKVVTNSIIIAEELRPRDNISVILLGGEMDHKGNCYDSIAVETIRRLRFDKSFITSAFISVQFGLSIQKTIAISFYEAIVASSKKVIGLYPKEKIGFDSVVSICPAEKLDIMITDWDAAETDLASFEEKGIDVIMVEKEEKVPET